MGDPEIEGWAGGDDHYWELHGDVSLTGPVILYYDSPLVLCYPAAAKISKSHNKERRNIKSFNGKVGKRNVSNIYDLYQPM